MARSKKKKKHRPHRQHHALFGITAGETSSYKETLKEGGLILLAAVAAGGAGAALGKHSLLAGIPLTLVGIHKKNKYVIAAGLGMTMSNGFQGSGSSVSGIEDNVEGFDIAQITQNAKDRVSNFFSNFKDKLYIAKAADAGINGLGEAEEQVSYFVNPYKGTGELDTSALDKIQEQIAQMNKNVSGLNEVDREF